MVIKIIARDIKIIIMEIILVAIIKMKENKVVIIIIKELNCSYYSYYWPTKMQQRQLEFPIAKKKKNLKLWKAGRSGL